MKRITRLKFERDELILIMTRTSYGKERKFDYLLNRLNEQIKELEKKKRMWYHFWKWIYIFF